MQIILTCGTQVHLRDFLIHKECIQATDSFLRIMTLTTGEGVVALKCEVHLRAFI